MVTGIICEYNPFHNGHKKQIDIIKAADPEGSVVCLMSGNFVQRGAPAIIDKYFRAKSAVLCGADLVLELPVTYALRSAEGFAAGGVQILSGFCDRLSFGAENADAEALMHTAQILLSEEFVENLRMQLSEGLSFPAARQKSLIRLGGKEKLVSTPNNILGVEYCKAILTQGSNMVPAPMLREGDYHDISGDKNNPSATFLRDQMFAYSHWQPYTSKEAAQCFTGANLHSTHLGERAILCRLRSMTEEDFQALPYGSEGLWRKLMHNAGRYATLEEILEATKSKRYTRSRLDRMVMCAYLGITASVLEADAPYARVLAFNEKGRRVLKSARDAAMLPNIGERTGHSYEALEDRCNDLYALCGETIEPAGTEMMRRVFSL